MNGTDTEKPGNCLSREDEFLNEASSATNQQLDRDLSVDDPVKVNNNASYEEGCCRYQLHFCPEPYPNITQGVDKCNGLAVVDNQQACISDVHANYGVGCSKDNRNFTGTIQVVVGSNNLGVCGSESRTRENGVRHVSNLQLNWSEARDELQRSTDTPNEDEDCTQNNSNKSINSQPVLGINIAPNAEEISSCRCNGSGCRKSGDNYTGNLMNLPSTSNAEGLWNVWKEDVKKCPSKVRNGSSGRDAQRRVFDSDDEDSWSENEGDEDSCVYTYKGSLQADLPRSFLTLDRIANGIDNPAEDVRVARVNRSGSSSPDNEFLEMDFDPGPSLDLDESEEQEIRVTPVPELPNEQPADENDLSADNENGEVAEIMLVNVMPQPGSSRQLDEPVSPPVRADPPSLPLQTSPCPPSLPHRGWSARDSWGHHCSSGDLCSPLSIDDCSGELCGTLVFWNPTHNSTCSRVEGESGDTRKYNLFSDLYHCIMAKRLVMEKNAFFTDVKSDNDSSPEEQDSPPVERTMIWTEQEACDKQVTQISTSACGATALINAMVALNVPFSRNKIKKGVNTRLRQENSPLPQYLQSRSVAGATHEDIIRGVNVASEGKLYARFFHMHPERRFSLSKWLSCWLRYGAVPIATLNLQAGLPPGAPIPDAWHHQMIFGVSPCGVFVTNPLECVAESALMPQLCSPSILKIKRSDVLQRWSNSTDLWPLYRPADDRWKKLNVLGQVVNMIRESVNCGAHGRVVTQHITIPAAYRSGITIIISADSPHFEALRDAPELPLLHQDTQHQ